MAYFGKLCVGNEPIVPVFASCVHVKSGAAVVILCEPDVSACALVVCDAPVLAACVVDKAGAMAVIRFEPDVSACALVVCDAPVLAACVVDEVVVPFIGF